MKSDELSFFGLIFSFSGAIIVASVFKSSLSIAMIVGIVAFFAIVLTGIAIEKAMQEREKKVNNRDIKIKFLGSWWKHRDTNEKTAIIWLGIVSIFIVLIIGFFTYASNNASSDDENTFKWTIIDEGSKKHFDSELFTFDSPSYFRFFGDTNEVNNSSNRFYNSSITLHGVSDQTDKSNVSITIKRAPAFYKTISDYEKSQKKAYYNFRVIDSEENLTVSGVPAYAMTTHTRWSRVDRSYYLKEVYFVKEGIAYTLEFEVEVYWGPSTINKDANVIIQSFQVK